VATISHELAHALLLGDGRISGQVPDHEWVTDLTTVFLGLGVFGSNSAIREEPASTGHRHLSSSGYMSELIYAYALALFAWARGETKPSWAGHLRPNVRASMKQALRFLAKTNDSLIGPDGYVRVGYEHDGQGTGALIAALRSSSSSRRLAGVRELRQRQVSPTDVVEPMIDLLTDPDLSVLDEAAYLLGSFGKHSEAAVPALLGLAYSQDSDLRVIALATLGEIGANAEQVVPVLEAALDDPDKAVRQMAAFAIGAFGEDAATLVPTLDRQISGLINETMMAPIWALGMLGHAARPAVPNLLRVMHKGEGESREAAAQALGQIRDKSEPVIIALCEVVVDDDDDVHVRDAALNALAQLSLDRDDVHGTLLHAMEHEDLETRMRAALALSKTEGQAEAVVECFKETMVLLLNPANDESATDVNHDLFPAAARALRNITPGAIQPLIEQLSATDPLQQSFAAWALGRIGVRAGEALVPLRNLQTGENTTLQLISTLAAWNISRQDDEAVRSLVNLLSNYDLSKPLDVAFHLCELGQAAAGLSTAFLERLPDRRELHRAVIHLAIREIGDVAVAPLLELLPHEKEVLCKEISTLLAAIDHRSTNNLLEAEARLLEHQLDVRKWISHALEMEVALAQESRRFKLTTLEIPDAPEPVIGPAVEDDADIFEAEWLLIHGITFFAGR